MELEVQDNVGRYILSLDSVNRKLGAATIEMNVTERYRQVLLDLGVNDVDWKYIVPLPVTLPTNSLQPLCESGR